MPLQLAHGLHLVVGAQWRVYVPALLAAGLVMGVALPRMRGLRASIRALQFSALLLALGLAALAFARGSLGMGILGAVLFFVAFSMLEASLPSLVSRLAQPARRGAALGAYSAAQFFGVIVGGACGGVLLGMIGVAGVFATAAIVALLWSLMLLPAGARLGQPTPAGAWGAG
ncbi:Major facilitator superfamily MFS-1 [mine drainage metagenome]|uniref:Major facilitator superfamily MFS-1 n=1 Tax=mine drainage metagenome TaxID=410659 RepID=T1B361_9ZZZZ